jgi:phosphoribosylformimino-5-aminoimidazole carboxamide ribonucleotide (ProFAR) isomerase
MKSVSGWLEESDEDLIPFIQGYQAKGIKHVICTDIAKTVCSKVQVLTYMLKFWQKPKE